ncbi:hypothetical protein RUM43_004618 [Polyplax serrata]|uniref:Anticodon-binding domain-containing protein n=1 Tax=Polyplax serrata TaxID=468196 RepID=A0AAN8SDJ8_POLSC
MYSVKVADKIIKNTNQKVVVDQVKTMLSHFELYNFITKTDANNIQLDFNSESLKQEIKKEWLLTNTILSDQPAFLVPSLNNKENFIASFEGVKNMVSTTPFSLIEVASNHELLNKEEPFLITNEVDLVRKQFKSNDGFLLANHTFCMPQNAMEFFHKQQRDRKIWWRRFSALPCRFHTTEICHDDNTKSQFVELKAEFPWGIETVEVITYSPKLLHTDKLIFEMKNQKKKFFPHMVTCKTLLEKATLTYLCDSFEKFNEETDREMLRFSKKLAPYKVAFAGSGNDFDTTQNLKELAMLLAKKMRKCGISVLMLSDMCTNTIERQMLRNDALGIPYTVLLNENTLKDGIIDIRSRDTTLREQSHVSLVVSYLEKLIKTN